MDLARITVDHQNMGGVPCVAGTRIPVATVVGLVANGLTTEEIIAEYPQLTPKTYKPAWAMQRGPSMNASFRSGSPREILDRRVRLPGASRVLATVKCAACHRTLFDGRIHESKQALKAPACQLASSPSYGGMEHICPIR